MNPPSPAPWPAPASSPRPRRRWVLPVVVAIVVIAVVVAALYATGTLHLGGSASNSSYETFSQARGVAQSRAGSVPGGTWFAAAAAGIATPSAVLEEVTNLSSLTSNSSCTLTWPNGEPANIEIPATAENAPTGAAAFWTVVFENASDALLVETVSDGSAAALFVATGATCEEVASLLAPFPSGVYDSPSIVTAADQAGGSTFLAAHPNATRTWSVYGGVRFGEISTTPDWLVDYTTCAVPPIAGENGSVFNATVAGLTGDVLNSSSGNEECAPSVPVNLGLPLPGAGAGPAARKAI